MARLSSWFLPTLLAQTLGLSYEAIRRRRQMTVVAIFPEPLLQHFDLLAQGLDLLLLQVALLFQQADVLLLVGDQFPLQANLLSQQAIFFSKLSQLFFCCHALTLHGLAVFDKSLGDLSSYKDSFKRSMNWYNHHHNLFEKLGCDAE